MLKQEFPCGKNRPVNIDLGREVIRCRTCGLVQYRIRAGTCRRCLHLLGPNVQILIPSREPQEVPEEDRKFSEKGSNRETVENMGQRIRQLRVSCGMTQLQLQARSRVSRSYLARIECGLITPSLGTVEKIAEALGICLSRFFVPLSRCEALLQDPFIRDLRPLLGQLDWEQRQSILKRLAAISHRAEVSLQSPQRVARLRPRNQCFGASLL